MISWLKNTAMVDKKKLERGSTFSAFEHHWKQAAAVMETSDDAEGALTVIQHLNQMITFLKVVTRTDREEETEQSCRHFWVQNQCSDKVTRWLHELHCRGMQLPSEDDEKLVQMLQSIVELSSREGFVVSYGNGNTSANANKTECWDGACSLASLLLEYTLRSDSDLGVISRSSFDKLIQLASKFPALEKSLSEQTGVTYVIISALSACYAQLPTFSQATDDQLEPFIIQLKFVDTVTHSAPTSVAENIADCFYNAFLHTVILPAMTQDEGGRSLHRRHDRYVTSLHEEISIVTQYLRIVSEQLTHPFLIRNLTIFVTSQLLPILVQRMNHQSIAVTIATLSLLNVLLQFYCEDFWYELILRYLIPQHHLMVSQRGSVLPEVDFQSAAVKFLSLVPSSVIEALGAECITNCYVQYLNNESYRWSSVDNFVFTLPPSVSRTGTEYVNGDKDNSESCSTNSVFPHWQFKYDGSECCQIIPFKRLEQESPSNLQVADCEKFSSCESASEDKGDEIPSDRKQDDTGISVGDVSLSDTLPTQFTTISLQPTSDGNENTSHPDHSESDSSSPEHSRRSLRKEHMCLGITLSDGYASMDSSPVAENAPTFGPFLDCLLNHLQKWAYLHPDVILMVTEIVSTLASSRVPLVVSFFIDPTLILQPSYTSFTSVLNRIRTDTDNFVKMYSNALSEVWLSMNARDAKQHQSPRGSISSSHSFDGSPSLGDSIADSIRKKIPASGSIAAALNHVFQRKSNVGPDSMLSPDGNGNQFGDSVHSVGTQGYRYVNRLQSGPLALDTTKIMATRVIFFTHWLLEMGAISQQLCWKKNRIE